MSRKITPIKVRQFRSFLKVAGCTYDRIKGDHEIWVKPGLKRPIVFPIKDKEITPRIIVSNLNTLGISPQEYLNLIA